MLFCCGEFPLKLNAKIILKYYNLTFLIKFINLISCHAFWQNNFISQFQLKINYHKSFNEFKEEHH